MDFETNELMWVAFKLDASPAQSFPELKLKTDVLQKFNSVIEQSMEKDREAKDADE